jgi:hypothetical protein
MSSFDDRNWNLAQVAAWVVYREPALVDQLATPAPHAYGAIGLYKSMWPAGRKRRDNIDTLHKALVNGRLIARGYKNKNGDELLEIPSREWVDLHLAPPYAYKASNLVEKNEPWLDIRMDSAITKKLWRSGLDVDGRTGFDPSVITMSNVNAYGTE